ncbi:avidin-like [Candoia aspera]|uniref:avidin-like n=1 Tax=Candoia aspera TaxID=51853 RepID=UPI002FD830AA
MTIAPTNNPEEFQGSYLTAVSATDSAIQRSPLKGFQHHVDQRAQPTFGFTVHWSFSNSITAFTGQCFLNAGGREQLQTTWLLRSEVGSISEDWGATRVGTNTFHRIS